MLTFSEKAKILKNCLEDVGDSYADSFKTDLLFYFEDFEEDDSRLEFLQKLETKHDIELWVERITSRIVLKFDEEEDSLGDFVFYESEVKS